MVRRRATVRTWKGSEPSKKKPARRSSGNTLFEPYARNHCRPSKPLGTWTTTQNAATQSEEDEDGDDE